MIRQTFYKDRPAVEVCCDNFSALFLPLDGAKMASFQTKSGYEFLAQAKGETYRHLSLEFDGDIVKYLGVWVNPGALNGMYTMAVEPCTALYDSPANAEAAYAASYIKSGETISFSFRLTYKEEVV